MAIHLLRVRPAISGIRTLSVGGCRPLQEGGTFFLLITMSTPKPKTRTEAAKPARTGHLTEADKRALDTEAEAEHTDGQEREKLTRKMTTRK